MTIDGFDKRNNRMEAVKLCYAKPNSTGEEDKRNYVYAINKKKNKKIK